MPNDTQNVIDTLANRIAKRIAAIPAQNPGYISCQPETLSNILSHNLIRTIAQEAADEAERKL